MTTTLADAERIRQASERSGALVFVGHITPFHPAFAAALALLPSLGTVRYLLSEGMNGSARSDCIRSLGLAPARNLDGARDPQPGAASRNDVEACRR